MKALAVALVALLTGTGVVAAQEIEDGSSSGWIVGASVGGGSGPTPVALAEGSVGIVPVAGLALRLSIGGWTSFGVACNQQWPDSYACDSAGWSGRIGVEASPVRLGFLVPFIEVDGGLHSRSGPSSRWTHEPVVGAGIGTRFEVGRRWSVRIHSRYSWIFDEAYEELMGENLRLTAFTVGVEYRP